MQYGKAVFLPIPSDVVELMGSKDGDDRLELEVIDSNQLLVWSGANSFVQCPRILGMLRCPNCSGEMREVRKYGVHIDYCPVCRGIWLDRGEVDKIVLSAPAAAVSEETAGENIVAGNGERGYELNRILSELRKEGRIS